MKYLIEVREDEIEQITSLSACGLGFVAHLMDSFVEAGTKIGLSREIATQITLQTFYGAVKTTSEDNFSPEKLRECVATKGGATEEGLHVIEEGKVALAIEEAVEASYRKALSFGR
jgi:pyrroline-5-carboxylate reductase